MSKYVTGSLIKQLREKKGMTQEELAEKINVTGKAVSKWETAKGYPDISILEPLSKCLGVSVIELLAGNDIVNGNRCGNIMRTKFYVCPVCGNIIMSLGDAVVSCCGITLPPLSAEEGDENHLPKIEIIEDEYYVTFDHEMTKEHYISFVAGVTYNGITMIKLYSEGNAEARFKRSGLRYIYYYCNRHGLMKSKI